jgi:hypothetical protein
MPTRRPISKRVRFSVLDRDGSTCQYCGAKPADGALHVDHIIPIADGGSNEMDNLITSCEPCNTGKGARVLASAPIPDMKGLAVESERRRFDIERWRQEHAGLADAVLAAAEEMKTIYGVTVPSHVLCSAIKQYGAEGVAYACQVTGAKVARDDARGQTGYLFAILRNRAAAGYQDHACPFGADNVCPDWSKAEGVVYLTWGPCYADLGKTGLCCSHLLEAFDTLAPGRFGGNRPPEEYLTFAGRVVEAVRRGAGGIVAFCEQEVLIHRTDRAYVAERADRALTLACEQLSAKSHGSPPASELNARFVKSAENEMDSE